MDQSFGDLASVAAEVLKLMQDQNKFTQSQKCYKYARFAHTWSEGAANAVFWSLFTLDIVCLVVASLCWASQDRHYKNFNDAKWYAQEHPDDQEKQEDLKRLKDKYHKSNVTLVYISLICTTIAMASVVVESFTGFCITFCHKADVPFLYWGFFFLLSVGSTIAMLGLCVGIIWSGRRPPWNLNLGTPVLVIPGLVHVAWTGVRDNIRKMQGKEPKHSRDNLTIPITKHPSMAMSQSRLFLNPAHGTVFQVLEEGVEVPPNMEVTGHWGGKRLATMLPSFVVAPVQPSSVSPRNSAISTSSPPKQEGGYFPSETTTLNNETRAGTP